MESAERTARQKEQAEKDKHERMNADLKEARLQQQAEKERRLGEQAKFERDEFERIIEAPSRVPLSALHLINRCRCNRRRRSVYDRKRSTCCVSSILRTARYNVYLYAILCNCI